MTSVSKSVSSSGIPEDILHQANQKLGDHQYVTLELSSADKKAQQTAYIVLEKTGSLETRYFNSAEERERYCQNLTQNGYRQIEVHSILKG